MTYEINNSLNYSINNHFNDSLEDSLDNSINNCDDLINVIYQPNEIGIDHMFASPLEILRKIKLNDVNGINGIPIDINKKMIESYQDIIETNVEYNNENMIIGGFCFNKPIPTINENLNSLSNSKSDIKPLSLLEKPLSEFDDSLFIDQNKLPEVEEKDKLQELQDLQDLQDLKDLQDLQDLQELPETPEIKSYQDNTIGNVNSENDYFNFVSKIVHQNIDSLNIMNSNEGRSNVKATNSQSCDQENMNVCNKLDIKFKKQSEILNTYKKNNSLDSIKSDNIINLSKFLVRKFCFSTFKKIKLNYTKNIKDAVEVINKSDIRKGTMGICKKNKKFKLEKYINDDKTVIHKILDDLQKNVSVIIQNQKIELEKEINNLQTWKL